MTILKRSRFFFWVVKDLVFRYKRALLIGFFVGFAITIIVGRIAPIVFSSLTREVERIGIVGDVTPTNIPLSIQKLLSTGLTTIGPDGSASAGIATSWYTEDGGKTFIFSLGDNTWHNGKKLTASDINYRIQGVTFTTLEAHTIKAVLSEGYSPFPTLVSKPVLGVGLIGVGPYKVSKLQLKGDRIDILKIGPVGNSVLPVKEFRFYRTETMAALAFKRGDIDMIEDVSSPDLLSTWKGVRVEGKINYNRMVALYFNLKDTYLSERSLRQALAYGTPNIGEERAYSPVAKTSWAYTEKVRHFDFDEQQTKKLIDALKLPQNFEGLTITTFPQYERQANRIAEQWTKLGIPTKVKIQQSVSRDFQVLLSAQNLPPDPDQYPFWHSKQTETNIVGYTNLKIDKLLEDGRQKFDFETRKKIYADFQRFLVEDVPVVFLYYPKDYTVKREARSASAR